MFAIDDPTAVAVMPTPEAAGTPGFWTEGNPGLGQAATLMRASFFNGLQQELLNILAAANITPSKTTYNQLLSAILKIGGGSSRVRGLVGTNGSTPATQFDLSAAAVDFRDPTGGTTPSVTNVATITNNLLTAGPAANGRDQAGAFTPSSWIHFYFIYNPTTATVATISSATPPPTGPALPTGYTAWAYACSVYLNASSQLLGVNVRGSWVHYSSFQFAVNGGTSASLVAVPVTTLVPPNALEFEIFIQNLALTSAAGGQYALTCQIVTQLSQIVNIGLQGGGSASVITGISGPAKRIANIGQSFAYSLSVGNGVGPTVSIAISSYSVPNGG